MARARWTRPGLLALLLASSTAAAQPIAPPRDAGACVHGDRPVACAPYGCIPDAGPTADRDMLPSKAGHCGLCVEDADCGGTKCITESGFCSVYAPAVAPKPIRPRFSLVVADVATNLADETDPKPIVSVGYLFQGALRKATPVVRAQGGWITPDLPTWYGNAGISAAFAGPVQNIFADLGVTWYRPGLPLSLTTVSFGAVYQRYGESVWSYTNTDENTDRLGPGATLGFLQNLYLRGAYVFPVRGAVDHGAAIVSVVYMRDLAGDLVPDRFRKHLPHALR